MSIALNALSAVALGAIGWLALGFLGRPLREFFDLRRRVREYLLKFEDATSRAPFLRNDDGVASTAHPEAELADGAIVVLRGLSAELIAFGDSEWLADPVLRPLGFQSSLAGRALREFTSGRSSQHKALKALKLPIR
jgi:hypothetical protein